MLLCNPVSDSVKTVVTKRETEVRKRFLRSSSSVELFLRKLLFFIIFAKQC